MSRPHRPRPVLIVGGGIIGLACAEALSREGVTVQLIDQGEPGRSASWAGGGLLSPLPPDVTPEALRVPLAESLAQYPAWCERLHEESGIDPEYWVCGATQTRATGERREYPDIAQVRNPRLLQALLAVLRKRGVSLRPHTRAMEWVEAQGSLRGLRTEDGEVLECDTAILAAGAWSAALGASGVVPVKGQMLLCRSAPGQLERALIGDDAYLIPRRDGGILVGSTLEDAGFDVTPTAEAREQLLDAGARLWPALGMLPVEAHWAGLRPRAPTVAPIVGAHPLLRGLWLATGHFRLGITLAPGTATTLAGMLRLTR